MLGKKKFLTICSRAFIWIELDQIQVDRESIFLRPTIIGMRIRLGTELKRRIKTLPTIKRIATNSSSRHPSPGLIGLTPGPSSLVLDLGPPGLGEPGVGRSAMETRIVEVPEQGPLGEFRAGLDQWCPRHEAAEALAVLGQAAEKLRMGDRPVAFPTETVYGLGADATRSSSVRGVFAAKGRPSDNPLIVHVADLQMLKTLLRAGPQGSGDIPARYEPLIKRFWPGPLTILLPNPEPSRLAPEVTAGLDTFGVRMPSSPLALTLIKLAGVPLAAPSANASTRPSPTTAQHVLDDLDGRIELILDGGPCQVGVESTVVDGLHDPPVVLRPGGVGLEELRSCPGWADVRIGYRDESEEGKAAPRAPGMKYKHYSPKAAVVLFEASCKRALDGLSGEEPASKMKIGVIRTRRWKPGAGLDCHNLRPLPAGTYNGTDDGHGSLSETTSKILAGDVNWEDGLPPGRLYDIDLGTDSGKIGRGLFSALRDLDRIGVDIIFVDGIDDDVGVAAAVMNRLRKAASEIRA